ncbi:uncharacterized protein DUF1043 [Thiogranum longum]|uniref:Z-ring associated protein G n=1 Tax=Thiogranum longum TaxID=1537524 RepID=A0A4V2PGV2_9GAMM|nr:DUF1043 family protein [Thiogranum longum]TCK18236.1 uncharacterized protein DUF1043 [Thiogranum longum]
MTGDETGWMWSTGLISFAFGIAAGYAIHFFVNSDNKHSEELEAELDQLKEEMEQYRGEVAEHFQRTSELVQEMTSSYKNVYEHLASGSAHLCSDAIQTPQLDFAMQQEITRGESGTEATATRPADSQ